MKSFTRQFTQSNIIKLALIALVGASSALLACSDDNVFPVTECHFGEQKIHGITRAYPDAGRLPVPVVPAPVEGTSYIDCMIPGAVAGEIGQLIQG